MVPDEPAAESLPCVAIAGASGFVGTFLRRSLKHRFRWQAITRSEALAEQAVDASDNTDWRHCDLFSLPQVSQATEGADVGVYLVHSMLPSSRLVQGHFRDLDLLLADNFARAAQENRFKHLVYLSGLQPDAGETPSEHLLSRLEVERVLRSCSCPVTVLRAGLIFGPGGSSAQMLLNLVRRLPLMVMPKWSTSMTQSSDIRDVVRAFEYALTEADWQGGTYDLGTHYPRRYRAMVEDTARVLDKRRVFVTVPVNLFPISRWWISWVSGTSPRLVSPLLESLKHNLAARENPLNAAVQDGAHDFDASVHYAVDPEGRPKPNPRASSSGRDKRAIRKARRVRSVQRMPLPEGWDAPQLSEAYGHWLTRRSLGVLDVQQNPHGVIQFRWRWPAIKLLELTPTPFSVGSRRRSAFYISGGFLSRKVEPQGRFEFRVFPESDCLVAAIHNYAPTLPWFFYARTQALIHLVVMRLFARYLRRVRSADAALPETAES